MIAFRITSLKNFMSQLLISDTFDIFLLEEAVISTANTYTIDGHINREFYQEIPTQDTEPSPPDDGYEFRPWQEIKELCFHLIKGKRTPLFCRFVLHLKPEQAESLLQKELPDTDISQIKAFILNVRYDGTGITLTTCTSYHTFVLSKEPDVVWDKAITKYLNKKDIEYEVL